MLRRGTGTGVSPPPDSPSRGPRRPYNRRAPRGRDLRPRLPQLPGAPPGCSQAREAAHVHAPQRRTRPCSWTRMAATAPSGCRAGLEARYYRLCDTNQVWGIVLEAVAAAGAVTSVAFMLSLLILICKVQDSNRRKALPTQFLFLLGVLGIFGLTFAFIIPLDGSTGTTRFFLFGILFALCFSCLLAHTFNLTKLVRGRKPLSLLVMLGLAVGFSLVQDVIAIEYVILTMNRTNVAIFSELPASRRNEDFVLLLIYVLFLMALTFLASGFTFCGSFSGWKRHGAHICLTMLLSIAIWVAWITLLLIPTPGPKWDDTILSSALVANGWVFLLVYVVPEFQLLTKQHNPMDYPVEDAFCKPQLMKQSYGVENRAYSREEITQESGHPEGFLHSAGPRSGQPLRTERGQLTVLKSGTCKSGGPAGNLKGRRLNPESRNYKTVQNNLGRASLSADLNHYSVLEMMELIVQLIQLREPAPPTQGWFCEDGLAQRRTADLSKNSKGLSLPESTLEANFLASSRLAWVGEAKGCPKFTHLWGA
ncbi:hypothetical protein MC885_010664 [Smutsia gigantea]|nr:hypothetical protein MC885_010664 [Smutsia gigantea]